MAKWFNENGNEFILSILAIIAVTTLAILKVITGDLAVGVIVGAIGMKITGLGGKKTITGIAIIGFGAGLLAGCGNPVKIEAEITANPAICGIETIYEGEPETEIKQVARIYNDNMICSGALIASDTVLSAKHCGTPSFANVWGATYAATETIQCDYGDLEIVKMDDHATDWWGANIEPLIIYVGDLSVGDKIHIAGYGKIYPANPIPGYPTGGNQIISVVGDGYIYIDGNPGVCDGDSGGPAMWGKCIVGIHHGRIGACGEGKSVITRLAKHEDWLRSINE